MKQYEDLLEDDSQQQMIKDSSAVGYGDVERLRLQGINLLWKTENVDVLSSLVAVMKRKYDELKVQMTKDDVLPYSIKELYADIDESERQFASGDFISGSELDRKVDDLIASWQ